jgi:rhodanese-related sulfurtransferase
MSKVTKSMASVAILAPDDPAFSQVTKHANGVGVAVNAPYSVGEAGMSCDDAVTVISNDKDVCCAEKKTPTNQLRHDLDFLTAMQLRSKYRGEANSHRNMLSREKVKGAVVHDSFRRFSDFLHHVGPKPTKSATLDRIDNTDPEYAPGKVRWADKHTQNRNKGDSLIFTCPTSGRSYTAGQLAKKQGVTAAAVRSRRSRGWTDAEVIAGQRSEEVPPQTVRPPAITPPARRVQKSTQQILFERNRAIIEHTRREEGVEPFIATPKETQEIFQDDYPDMRGEEWLQRMEKAFEKRKLPQYWKEYGPHINFAALRPDQQAWVLRIDPAQGQKTELADRL